MAKRTDKEKTTILKTTGAGQSGGFPMWYDFAAMIAMFFAATLVAALIFMIVKTVAPDMKKELLNAIVYFVQFLLAIGGVYAYTRFRGGTGKIFRFSIKWYNAALVILGILLILVASEVLEPILSLFPEKHFDRLNDAIGRGGWAILLTVMLAPVFEELLFRGVILEGARQKLGASKAIVLSALLFGLIHAPVLPQMVNAFVMGIMMGYIYVLTDSLLSVIIIHAVNNAIAYMLLEITGSQITNTRELIGNDTIYRIVYAACVVILIVSLVAMAVMASDRMRKRAEIAAAFSKGAEAEKESSEAQGGAGNNN